MKAIFFLALIFSISAQASEKPEQAALAFYTSYLHYQAGLAGRTRTVKEAKAQDREATKSFFTAGFWRQRLALDKKCAASKDEIPEGCDFDPYYCAQEAPTTAAIFKAKDIDASFLKGKSARVPVELCFNCVPGAKASERETRVVQVHLRKVVGSWLLEKIDCPKEK